MSPALIDDSDAKTGESAQTAARSVGMLRWRTFGGIFLSVLTDASTKGFVQSTGLGDTGNQKRSHVLNRVN